MERKGREAASGETQEPGLPPAKVGDENIEEAVTPPATPGAPVSFATAVQPATVARKEKPTRLLLILVPLVLVLIAGGIVGGILWARSGPGISAEIKSVKLALSDGKELNYESVPLNQDLTVTVEFLAEFPKDGEGKIVVSLLIVRAPRFSARRRTANRRKNLRPTRMSFIWTIACRGRA